MERIVADIKCSRGYYKWAHNSFWELTQDLRNGLLHFRLNLTLMWFLNCSSRTSFIPLPNLEETQMVSFTLAGGGGWGVWLKRAKLSVKPNLSRLSKSHQNWCINLQITFQKKSLIWTIASSFVSLGPENNEIHDDKHSLCAK